jgi:hypothetical protein
VQNLRQEVLMHNNQNAGSHQKKLPFEIDRVCVTLPTQVRESCRSLCRELLMTVLKKSERRQNERKD